MSAAVEGRSAFRRSAVQSKHANTRISTLRNRMGPDFAPGIHGNTKISATLEQLDKPSLSQLVKLLDKK